MAKQPNFCSHKMYRSFFSYQYVQISLSFLTSHLLIFTVFKRQKGKGRGLPPAGGLPRCLRQPGLVPDQSQEVGTALESPPEGGKRSRHLSSLLLPPGEHVSRKLDFEAELGRKPRHSCVGLRHPMRGLKYSVKCPPLSVLCNCCKRVCFIGASQWAFGSLCSDKQCHMNTHVSMYLNTDAKQFPQDTFLSPESPIQIEYTVSLRIHNRHHPLPDHSL